MTEFGREYGEGLYALCAEEKLDRAVLEEVQAIQKAFRENEAFLHLLGNMTMSKEERVRIVDETFRGQIHEYTLNFLKILVERGAIHAFSECAAAYQESYFRNHQVAVAEVTTAGALNEEQRARLMKKLKKLTGKEIVVKEKIDPSVLGGVLLQMDGKRYDNTVRHRLAAIKQTITEE
ncbi:MAG: ATP synthase F1 subunit delta [Clostridia bacterium]|nr:ATP synthase F1 subunit delta [Clostridia bacterium]